MRKEIINYLQGPRPWAAGVALYMKYGHNLMLRKTFMHRMETADLRTTLVEELRKLAGISSAELSQLKRVAAAPAPKQPEPTVDVEGELMELADKFGVTVDEMFTEEFQERVRSMDDLEEERDDLEEERDDLEAERDDLAERLEEAEKKYRELSPTVKKMIRFREKFKFLNQPDCPDELKVLVSDMFTALGKYKDAHAKLAAMPDDADLTEAARLAEECVENYLANREMWEELEYYQEHGEVLGKCAKLRALKEAQEIAALNDLELTRRYSSAQANTSKQRKRLKEAENAKDESKIDAAREALAKWEAKSTALREELEKRKKN